MGFTEQKIIADHLGVDSLIYSEPAGRYLDRMGLQHLTPEELDQIAREFSADMQAGLEGKPRSLAMYETHLSPTDLRQLPRNKRAFVAEVGGTHVRGAIVGVGSDGYPQIVDGLYSQAALGETNFTDADEFFRKIASRIDSRVLGHIGEADAAAYIHAFPEAAIETEYGIDVISREQLTKQIRVPGIGTQPVGISFFRSLESPPFPIVAGNDTPFVLLSGGVDAGWLLSTMMTEHQLEPDIDARVGMGVVNSSGMNYAIVINGKVYNVEAGNFDQVPTHAIAETVDQRSKEPGTQLAEKQVSGNWLGPAMGVVAEQMADDGLLDKNPEKPLSSVLVTDLLYGRLEELETALHQKPEAYPIAILTLAAARLRTRSAQIFGAMLSAGIRRYPQQFGNLAVIPCESTLMRYVPGYQQIVKEQVRRVGGVDPLFVHIPDAGILGAGAAALARLA